MASAALGEGQSSYVDALRDALRASVPAEAPPPPAAPAREGPGAPGGSDAAAPAPPDQLAELMSLEAKCAAIAERLDDALSMLSAVAAEKKSVSAKTSSLTKTCEKLLQEQTAFEEKLKLLEKPLEHFREVDRLAAMLGVATPEGGDGANLNVVSGAKINPQSAQFTKTLERIDESIAFFGAHARYRDSEKYRQKMVRVQSRALELCHSAMRDLCAGASRHASQHLQNADPAPEHALESWAPYARFRPLCPRLRLLSGALEKRATPANAAARRLFAASQEDYLQSRQRLLSGPVRKELARLALQGGRQGGQALLSLVRLGCSYLQRVVRLETQLFHESFGDSALLEALRPPLDVPPPSEAGGEEEGGAATAAADAADAADAAEAYAGAGALWRCLSQVVGSIYTLARPLLIHCNDLDALCALVETVREELERRGRQGEGGAAGGESGALCFALRRCAADAQERLALLGRQRLLSEVAAFYPGAGDLDYPARLAAFADGSEGDVFGTWYPPVSALLRLLAQLYRAVDKDVFEDIAHAAVDACTSSLLTARAALVAGKGSGGCASRADAALFLVRHLLVLREQLGPFNIRLLNVERSLDFSSTAQALGAFLREGGILNRNVLSMSASNPIVSLIVQGRPRVRDDAVDGKATLESHLKAGCNEWIDIAVKDILGPMHPWLEKLRAAGDGAADLPIAGPRKAQETVEAAIRAAEAALPALARQLFVYLQNPGTQAVLFRPVQKQVGEAVAAATGVLEVLKEAGQEEQWQPALDGLARLHAMVLAQDVADAPRGEEQGEGDV